MFYSPAVKPTLSSNAICSAVLVVIGEIHSFIELYRLVFFRNSYFYASLRSPCSKSLNFTTYDGKFEYQASSSRVSYKKKEYER